jgi:hypothetical protein
MKKILFMILLSFTVVTVAFAQQTSGDRPMGAGGSGSQQQLGTGSPGSGPTGGGAGQPGAAPSYGTETRSSMPKQQGGSGTQVYGGGSGAAPSYGTESRSSTPDQQGGSEAPIQNGGGAAPKYGTEK